MAWVVLEDVGLCGRGLVVEARVEATRNLVREADGCAALPVLHHEFHVGAVFTSPEFRQFNEQVIVLSEVKVNELDVREPEAVELGVLSDDEVALLERTEVGRLRTINVDDFAPEDLLAGQAAFDYALKNLKKDEAA